MKKFLICALSIVLCLLMISCGNVDIQNTIEADIKNTIEGKLNHAVCDIVYVYLSNISDISFEQAWKASGLSSNRNDYFSPEDAVLVEMKTE